MANSKIIILLFQVANTISRLPDFAGCGDTIGCFGYPKSCHGNECRFVVSYQYNSATDSFDFAMMGEKYDYISFGISEDPKMVISGIIWQVKRLSLHWTI